MRRIIQSACLSFGLVSMASTTLAAGKMKPGLWETTLQSDAIRNMPAIPPEQLEKLKQMGIKIPEIKNGGMTTQMCITPDMSDSDQPPNNFNEQAGCQTNKVQDDVETWTIHLLCDKPEMKGSGTVTSTHLGDNGLKSVFDFNGLAYDRPVNIHSETSGHWLSADCGDVRPMDLPHR